VTDRRLTTKDFHPEVMQLFDQYVHGAIDRRAFLSEAGRYAAGAAGAAGLLAALSPRFAQAQQVSPEDTRLDAKFIDFDSPEGHGTGRGYLVRPAKAAGPLPLVLVIHENRGLNPHIEDVTRRMALENFIAFAPDALNPAGGYPGDEDQARTLFRTIDQTKARADFVAAAQMLRKIEGGNGNLGAVGFCYGGSITNFLATQVSQLRAAVPFYGSAAATDDVPNIKAEMLVVFAEKDDRVNAQWPAYKQALKAAGVTHDSVTYPGSMHGFNNDTTPRYDEEAAGKAWARTLALFNRTLRA